MTEPSNSKKTVDQMDLKQTIMLLVKIFKVMIEQCKLRRSSKETSVDMQE